MNENFKIKINILDLRKRAGTAIGSGESDADISFFIPEGLKNRGTRTGISDIEKRVAAILDDVRNNGDEAVCRYTKKFDGVEISEKGLQVSENEIDKAMELIDPMLLDSIKKAAANIEFYHKKQLTNSWLMSNPINTVNITKSSGTDMPMTKSVPVSVPVPVPVPMSASASMPAHTLTQLAVPFSMPEKAPVPAPVPVSMIVPAPESVPAPVPVSMIAPAPESVPAPVEKIFSAPVWRSMSIEDLSMECGISFENRSDDRILSDKSGLGALTGQLVRPIDTVGVYVPGGTAALASSVLMNVIPAKVAGVRRVIMMTPPSRVSCEHTIVSDKNTSDRPSKLRQGLINPVILAAARVAGVHEIYRAGGAQAIAAMAYGTATIPKVDKITGPGNIYVATAKKMVYGICGIDMIAGPSEIAIVADNTANPVFVAADILSQAEHDELAASLFVTDSEKLGSEVLKELERQATWLPRRDIACKSLEKYGWIVIVDNLADGMNIINEFAPEHLELCVSNPFSLLGLVRNAGAVFLGSYSPEPLGDYIAGPNHVLPTGGTARFYSPLGVDDFIKKTSVIYYPREAFETVSSDIERLASAEGLEAHASAARVRMEYIT